MEDGEGEFTWPNGAEYFGGWQDGMAEGRGSYVWPAGVLKWAGVAWHSMLCLGCKRCILLLKLPCHQCHLLAESSQVGIGIV